MADLRSQREREEYFTWLVASHLCQGVGILSGQSSHSLNHQLRVDWGLNGSEVYKLLVLLLLCGSYAGGVEIVADSGGGVEEIHISR